MNKNFAITIMKVVRRYVTEMLTKFLNRDSNDVPVQATDHGDQDDSMMSVSYSQHWTEALPLNRLNVSSVPGREHSDLLWLAEIEDSTIRSHSIQKWLAPFFESWIVRFIRGNIGENWVVNCCSLFVACPNFLFSFSFFFLSSASRRKCNLQWVM